MRYEVRDETGSVLRKFATKHEAQYFSRLDKELWIKVNPKVKRDMFAEAYQKLGVALL